MERLILGCIVVADKLWNDEFLTNTDYAAIGGINPDELNFLEKRIVILLDFELFIEECKYEEYKRKLGQLFKHKYSL